MHKFYFAFLLSVSFLSLDAQNIHCDGNRYLNEIFTNTSVTSNVKYGENTTVGGVFQELFMDVYEPIGDIATKRPVMMVGFGGSFIGGSKTDPGVIALCELFTRKGYVAVAYDYRLYDGPFIPLPDSTAILGTVARAIGDLKAAIRFMREDAATNDIYKIDPDFVFAGGISAGAILTLHTAFVDDIAELPGYLADSIVANGGLEGNSSPNYIYSASIQGIMSLSGGIHRKSFIDLFGPPVVSIHETGDNVVPYGFGTANVSVLPIVTLDGSGSLHSHADDIGLENQLITVNGSGHVGYASDPVWMDSLDRVTSTMFHNILCSSPSSTESQILPHNMTTIYPNPSSGLVNIKTSADAGNYDLRLFDATGRLVFQTYNVDVINYQFTPDLSTGFYIAELTFTETDVKVKKKVIFK